MVSVEPWRLIAPIGPIESGEVRWYLEKWAVWPSSHFADRARRVEQALRDWGRLLYQAALPSGPTTNVLAAWGETRLIFTSRESLPAPFDSARHRRDLRRLDREDAVKLIERLLNTEHAGAAGSDERREAISTPPLAARSTGRSRTGDTD